MTLVLPRDGTISFIIVIKQEMVARRSYSKAYLIFLRRLKHDFQLWYPKQLKAMILATKFWMPNLILQDQSNYCYLLGYDQIDNVAFELYRWMFQ